jgi:SPASM domain peptide maturase of grasp-with-spasm system
MGPYNKRNSNIHITAGVQRAILFDSFRKKYYPVPLSLIDFLDILEGKTLEETLSFYNKKDVPLLQEYYTFLLEKEIVFHCASMLELDRFPEMDIRWNYAAGITNAVVEVSGKDGLNLFNRFKGDYFIPYIQFNITCRLQDQEELESFIDLMLFGHIKGIQVAFDNSMHLTAGTLAALCNRKGRIESLIAFNSEDDTELKSLISSIYMRRENYMDVKHCGIVDPQYFNLQLPHYTESLAHNTCLNRKIAIDAEGNIKNCPSMKEHFGNIRHTTLAKAIAKPGFRKYWSITKDQVTKCRDCEFRHICTDCRAYTDNPKDRYAAPLKCGYNPYTCCWEEWSTNPLKQQAIYHYGMQEIFTRP